MASVTSSPCTLIGTSAVAELPRVARREPCTFPGIPQTRYVPLESTVASRTRGLRCTPVALLTSSSVQYSTTRAPVAGRSESASNTRPISAPGPVSRLSAGQNRFSTVACDGVDSRTTAYRPNGMAIGCVSMANPIESSSGCASCSLYSPGGTLSMRNWPNESVVPSRLVPVTNTVAAASGPPWTLSIATPMTPEKWCAVSGAGFAGAAGAAAWLFPFVLVLDDAGGAVVCWARTGTAVTPSPMPSPMPNPMPSMAPMIRPASSLPPRARRLAPPLCSIIRTIA